MPPVELHAFIESLARHAGEAILPFFRTQLGVEHKGGHVFDPVTEADRAAELVIRAEIRARFPNHGICGEEFPPEQIEAEYQWLIDPIDGTRAFICGLPLWGTLIGLMRDQTPVLGVLNQPYIGELFIGDGAESHVKGPRGRRDLACRACHRLAEAHVMTTDPGLFAAPDRARFEAIRSKARLTRYGADCYAYAMLSAGHVDLVIETGLKPHDIVALIPIIEGAGGVVSTWEGEAAASGGRIIAAGTPELHAAACKILAG